MKEVKHNEISDEELVKLYLETQKERFFDLIYNRYSGKVYAKCISLLKDEVNAADALQEVFIKIILKLSKFKGNSKLSTWIYAITYNHCIDLVRRKKRLSTTLEEDIEKYDDVEDEIDDAEILETNISRLRTVLDKMKIVDKSILLMKYQDGMSIKEISGTFDKSESAIKMQIKRAKEKFKRMYSSMFQD